MATRHMKRRRNADDRIRELERVANSTKAVSDIVRYWEECIRTKVQPKATLKSIQSKGRLMCSRFGLCILKNTKS